MVKQPLNPSSTSSSQAGNDQVTLAVGRQSPAGSFLPASPGSPFGPGSGGFMQQGQGMTGMPFPPQAGGPATSAPGGQLPLESSYIENILRLNLGKMATIYMTYENNNSWNAQVYRGVLEAAGRDHIIISDPATGMRFLLLMVNLDYITFDGPLNYSYPFA